MHIRGERTRTNENADMSVTESIFSYVDTGSISTSRYYNFTHNRDGHSQKLLYTLQNLKSKM